MINLNTFFVIHLFSDQSGLHAALTGLIEDDRSLCFVLNVVWKQCYWSCRKWHQTRCNAGQCDSFSLIVGYVSCTESDVCVRTWTSLREDLDLSWTAHLLSYSDGQPSTGTCRTMGGNLAKEVMLSDPILLVYRLFRVQLNSVESHLMR